MLRRQGPGHPPLRQERAGGRLPAGLQPLPRRRSPAVGLLQPARVRLGQGVLRRPTRPRQDPPCRAQGARQPLAGGLVALPAQGRALRRGHPRRQPQPRPRPRRLNPWLTKGVSQQHPDAPLALVAVRDRWSSSGWNNGTEKMAGVYRSVGIRAAEYKGRSPQWSGSRSSRAMGSSYRAAPSVRTAEQRHMPPPRPPQHLPQPAVKEKGKEIANKQR